MVTIQGVVVNHNTSLFTELCLRSLFAMHSADLDIAIAVLDNNSQDDSRELRAYAATREILFLPSGFTLNATNNTHGEVMRDFILKHPDPLYYLLLDTDICFLERDALVTMQSELEADEHLFAIQARMTVNGIDELPGSGWHINANNPMSLWVSFAEEKNAQEYRGLLQPRCHPGCTLIKNTPVFRRVVESVGLSTAWLFGETQSMRGFYDTFGLTCLVMKTHDRHYSLSSAMVQHLFSVSYNDEAMEWKQRVAHEKLAHLRAAN